ncbi:hypothetical protein Bca101_035974 [Brassica carinata]
MAYLERSSPTLKETLLKIYRAEKPIEIDQHFYEFGSIQYHIKCSVLDTNIVYVSTSTLLETQGIVTSKEILSATYEVIKNIAVGVIDIVDPPRLGFQLTLKLHLDNIPRGKAAEAIKIITRISEIQAIILSSQLKEMLKRLNFQDDSQAMNNNNRPVRIVYHPSEPFYVFRQAEKITAVFPMNFKDNSDVVIAMSFFQELVEVGSQKEMGKAPQCSWSPVPPFQLRGEPVHDLTTNAGFVSFGACEGTKRQIDDATEMQGYDKESEDKQISDQNQRLCSISLQSALSPLLPTYCTYCQVPTNARPNMEVIQATYRYIILFDTATTPGGEPW